MFLTYLYKIKKFADIFRYSHILKKQKKKKSTPNMSRLSYTKTPSLYFINTLAIMSNCNHD